MAELRAGLGNKHICLGCAGGPSKENEGSKHRGRARLGRGACGTAEETSGAADVLCQTVTQRWDPASAKKGCT